MKASPTETVHIVSGPIPDEYGNACFIVQVGDRRVNAIATPVGSGLGEPDFDVSAPVMNAISDFRRQAPDRVLACLRQAALLRRAAGHTTELAVPVPDSIVVRPNPELRDIGADFTVNIGTSSVCVLVTRDGAIVHDYDPQFHPDGDVAYHDLLAAQRAVLDFVLAHPDDALSWALDCELLDLFWN